MQPIFVGDVQGCADELGELLQRARARFSEAFELWIVGDLVNRGPHNLRLLETVHDFVERGRARYVLGNHEIGLLLTATGRRPLRPLDTFGDVLGSPDGGRWVEWLRRRPVVETGRLGTTDFALVHASIHPDWDLPALRARGEAIARRLGNEDPHQLTRLLDARADEDPDRDALERITRGRGLDPVTAHWTDAEPASPADAWHQHWARRDHRYGVVYGHWAMQGLHVAPWLRGLDTGCVHHGRGQDGFLTAWIPDPAQTEPFRVPDDRFWQIPARRRYIAARPPGAW